MSAPLQSFNGYLDADLTTHRSSTPAVRAHQARCRIVRDQFRSGELSPGEYYHSIPEMIQEALYIQVSGGSAYRRSQLKAQDNQNDQKTRLITTQERLLRKLVEKRRAQAAQTTTTM
jgi:hypothetical protein